VTAETAILLSRALGTTPDLWLNLQVAIDLWDAEQRLYEGAASAPHKRLAATVHAPPTPLASRAQL
jgi:antitoxin HigA-1